MDEQTVYVGPERRSDPHLTLKATIKDAFKEALTETLKDQDVIKGFWAKGYEELTGHAGNSATQWVGRRILTALVTAVFGAALVYLVRQGAIK